MDSHYAILNVPRDATNDEIRDSYKRMSRVYHPDRHADADSKLVASMKFAELSNAYEVLSDPRKRQIYDHYGAAALDGMKVSENATNEELRAEHGRYLQELKERKRETKRMLDGTMVASFFYDPERVLVLETLRIDQHKRILLNNKVQLGLGGGFESSEAGQVKFCTQASLRRQFSSRGAGQISAQGLGDGRCLYKLDAERQLSTHCRAALYLKYLPGYSRQKSFQGSKLALRRMLTTHTQGLLDLGFGLDHGARIGVKKTKDEYEATCKVGIQRGDADLLKSKLARNVSRNSTVGLSIGVGISGPNLELSCLRRMSPSTILSVSVCSGVDGVLIKFGMNRLGQQSMLPVALSGSFELGKSLLALFLGMATVAAARIFYLTPIAREKRMRELSKQHQRSQAERREADADLERMREFVESSVRRETAIGGLVIVSAKFGIKSSFGNENQRDERWIDVTAPVQYLVEKSQLHFFKEAKTNFPGFYDICPGEEKALQIEYLFRDRRHYTCVNEYDPIMIPVAAHACE